MKNMEQTTNKNLHFLGNKLPNVQSVKMVTQLLLSLSVFSFIFSQPSLLSFLNSLNFCLSKFPYQLFTHTIDKNCMFLLCNGLLVFLAKYSGFIRLLSLSGLQEESDDSKSATVDVSRSDSQLQMLPQNKETMILDKEVGVDSDIVGILLPQNVDIKEEEGEGENEKDLFINNQGDTEIEKAIIVEDKKQEEESGLFDLKDSNEDEDEDDDEEEEESAIVHVEEDIYEDEEEEELENGKLSTEELNKKFDDFIRRMKEELRIEAQRHLIVV